MTGPMTKSSSKKGITPIIGWILLVLFTVGISTVVISWSKGHGEALTKSTVNYVEGRMDCQSVRLANTSLDCGNREVEVGLKNIGTLNIAKVSAQINDESSEMKDLDLKAQGEAKTLKTTTPFKKLKIIPIIESNEELIGCKEKSVTVYCP